MFLIKRPHKIAAIFIAATLSLLCSCKHTTEVPASIQISPEGTFHAVAGDKIDFSFSLTSIKNKTISPKGNWTFTVDEGSGAVFQGDVLYISEDYTSNEEFTDFSVNLTYVDSEYGTFTDSAIVRVYPKDYLEKPYTYAGNTYKGMTENTGKPIVSVNDTGKFAIKTPALNEVTCDGFFYLEGECFNKSDIKSFDKTLAVAIWKFNEEKKVYEYCISYPLTGSFARRIWLRDGAGTYKVLITTDFNISRCTFNEAVTGTSPLGYPYEGEFLGGITDSIFDSSNTWSSVYTVTNTRDEYGRYTYPSFHIQSDNFEIINLAEKVAHKGKTIEEKARLINKYIVATYPYDNNSLISGKRKKQDALSVYHFQTAICEGFADIFAALCRYYGISVKYVDGLMYSDDYTSGHAWNNISFDGGTTWFFVEPQTSKNFLGYYISDFNYYPDSEARQYISYIYNKDRKIDSDSVIKSLSETAEILNR